MSQWPFIAAVTLLTTLGVRKEAPSARKLHDGTIIERLAYSFPAYEKTDGVAYYASRSEYEKAVSDAAFEFCKLSYASDGLKVMAYLYKPRLTEGKRLPAILFNRGSGPTGDSDPLRIGMFHRLASAGFIILAPQYRGADGVEGHDEIGGADLDDVRSSVSLAKTLGYVDVDNLFMYGESRGGMMTYQAVRGGLPMNAAAVFGAFTDLEVMNRSPYVEKTNLKSGPIMQSTRKRSSAGGRRSTGQIAFPSHYSS